MKLLLTLSLLLYLSLPSPQPTASQPEPMRALVVGDSLSRGVAAPHNAGFAWLVADALEAELGVMASGSLFVAERQWPKWGWRDVDLIIVELSLHDVGSEHGLISDEKWQTRYGLFLDLLHQETGARIIAVTTFWTGVTEATNAERYNRILLYNTFIRKASDARPFVRVADVWSVTEGCAACISDPGEANPWPTLDFRGDNFHPGAYGHQVIAGEILATWRGWYGVFLPVVAK